MRERGREREKKKKKKTEKEKLRGCAALLLRGRVVDTS
jgi:hypothetical protein